MKGDGMQGQVLEDSPDVVLRPTRNAYVDIWEPKTNKFLHKVEDLFSRRWNRRRNRALVERVQDDVSWPLRLNGKHIFETFYHGPITGFPFSMIVLRIESGECVATEIGPRRKLGKERGEQVEEFLFIDVPKVKVKIGHGRLPSVAQGDDIFYDRRTELMSV